MTRPNFIALRHRLNLLAQSSADPNLSRGQLAQLKLDALDLEPELRAAAHTLTGDRRRQWMDMATEAGAIAGSAGLWAKARRVA